MNKWLLAASLAFASTAFGDELPEQTKRVEGAVQFWHRRCETALSCGLPEALSEKFPVVGEVARPSAPGQLGQYRTSLAAAELSLSLQVYWAAPPDGTTPYLIAQFELSQGARPIAECTQYAEQNLSVFSPVGACSAFLPAKGGATAGFEQLGVSFYRSPVVQ